MRFSKAAQWISAVFAVIAVVAIVFLNTGSSRIKGDLEALHAMGAPITREELRAATRNFDRNQKTEYEIIAAKYPDKIAKSDYRSRFLTMSELLYVGRKDQAILHEIADSKNLADQQYLNDPNFDARVEFASYIQNDIDQFEHPEQRLNLIRDTSTGSWRSFKDKVIYSKRIAAAAAQDLRLWRTAYERFPKGKVDPISAYHAVYDVLREQPPPDAYGDPLEIDTGFRRGMSRTQQWLTHIGRERATRALARMELDYLRTHKVPATLPDYGVDSTDPYNGEPFGFRIDRGYRDAKEAVIYSKAWPTVRVEMTLPSPDELLVH